jgi:hypothetical protein
MISLTPLAPPDLPGPNDFKIVASLIAIVSDPEAAKARLDQLTGAVGSFQIEIDRLKGVQADLVAQETAQKAALDVAKAAATASVDQERRGFERMMAERVAAVEERERAAQKLQAKAAADADAAAAMRIDLDRRLGLLKQAAA